MDAVNAVSDIHHLGEFVTGQNEGRKDKPITGNDLYNFAVQTDSNFMTLRGDIRNLGTVMSSEFKGVEARFDGIEARFSGVDNEFKLVRMEMASGFAAINARFEFVDARFNGVDAEFKGIDAEFKGIDAEFRCIDAKFKEVYAEFKALRAEMKEGFALLRIEIQRSNWRVSVSTIGAMIALLGIDRFWL